MRQRAISIFKKMCPGSFYALRRLKKTGDFKRNLGGAEYRATQALVSKYGRRVLNGPFRDMVYPYPGVFEGFLAKMIGSYEKPIHPAVEEMIERRPRVVINVGCAEGYYAVGLALRLPEAQVVAFDIADEPRYYCKQTANCNGVWDRVSIQGRADETSLGPLLTQKAAIVCDCEGFEDVLLVPERICGLRSSDILVELHDHLVPGVRERILERFNKTHDLQIIDDTPRQESDYCQLDCVDPIDRQYVIREGREAQMQWLWMRSRSGL